MKEEILRVEFNERIASGIYELTLSNASGGYRAGQFAEVLLKGFTLRRPFGVTDAGDKTLTFIYKLVGFGTKYLASLEKGAELNVLTKLGNGFSEEGVKKPLLIGGGIGAAPLYKLSRDFKEAGIEPTILLGFRNKDEIYYAEKFSENGRVIITTDDGSHGFHGTVLDYLKKNPIDYDRYFACGPMPMLKALKNYSENGQLSLEARMGCGFGACMGCSIRTTGGSKRVCKEGPIFDAAEVIFDE